MPEPARSGAPCARFRCIPVLSDACNRAEANCPMRPARRYNGRTLLHAELHLTVSSYNETPPNVIANPPSRPPNVTARPRITASLAEAQNQLGRIVLGKPRQV